MLRSRTERWVCFHCRKVWRKLFARRDGLSYQKDPEFQSFSCPACKTPLVDMGYRFCPPPRKDKRAWNNLLAYLQYHRSRKITHSSLEGRRLLAAIAQKRGS